MNKKEIVLNYKLDNGSTGSVHYVHSDYLGSIVALSDQSKNIETEFSYDAWGRRRNPADWSDYTVADHWLKRGYTGHEHIDIFDLINMNGRLYDPMLGRMLSPDNYVQASDFTQTYNRYSYALNNPMKYTDPSGEFIPFLIIGAIIAGDQMGYYSYHAGLGYWKGFSTGAMISVTTSLLGSGMSALGSSLGATGFIGGALWGAGSYALVGGLAGGMTTSTLGGDFWQGAKSGAIAGGISGGIIGGISGYINAIEQGRNPWTGSDYGKKWDAYKNASLDVMRCEFGDEVSDNVELKTRAAGFEGKTVPTKRIGYTSPDDEGYSYGRYKSKIIISKRVVKEWYNTGNIEGRGTISHEFYHAMDNYTGNTDRLFGNGYSEFYEFRAYNYEFNQYGTGAWGSYKFRSDLISPLNFIP